MQGMNLQILNMQTYWSIVPKTKKLNIELQKGIKENSNDHN